MSDRNPRLSRRAEARVTQVIKTKVLKSQKRKSKVVNQRIPGVYGQNINQRVVSRG